MKWLLKSISSRQEVYELRNSKERLLLLIYHPASGTLRISAVDEKRVFLIGREGFLRRHTVLRNEYGVRLGQLTYDNNLDNQGGIEFYNEQFSYLLQNNLPPMAAIYKNSETLAECELPVISENQAGLENYDLLILTLCWYISSSVRSLVREYA